MSRAEFTVTAKADWTRTYLTADEKSYLVGFAMGEQADVTLGVTAAELDAVAPLLGKRVRLSIIVTEEPEG